MAAVRWVGASPHIGGKPAKVALIAVVRRLIELLTILLKNPHLVLAR